MTKRKTDTRPPFTGSMPRTPAFLTKLDHGDIEPPPPPDDEGDGGDDGDDDEWEEIEGGELQEGDVIRCRLYRGIPGLPRFCAQGDVDTFTVGPIEEARTSGNQRYRKLWTMWAIELHEPVYIGDQDVVEVLLSEEWDEIESAQPESATRPIVQAVGVLLPAPKALPAPARRLRQ